MGYQRDPATHNIGCYAPLLDIARVRTKIRREQLTVPNKYMPKAPGMRSPKTRVAMSVADFYIKAVHDLVCDVEPDPEDARWADAMKKRHLADYDYDYQQRATREMVAKSLPGKEAGKLANRRISCRTLMKTKKKKGAGNGRK